MLWYKTWIETRARFLASLTGMLIVSSYQVFHADSLAEPDSKLNYYYFVLHVAQQMLSIMWILAVTLLNMDGLLHEKAAGTSSFTLVLPVSRVRIMRARLSLTFVEAIVLAAAPSAAMFVTGSIFGKTHSLYQAFFHLLLLTGGGLVFFALAVLCSSVIEGQYFAPMVSLGFSIMIAVIFNQGHLSYFSPFMCMIGADQYNRHTALLEGPVPWLRLSMFAFSSGTLVAAAIHLVRRRDF